MKILHTADWHLGHYLKGQENMRLEEHNLFLSWLLDTIENEQIDLLLIAGDIFDSANPPHWAEEQYYRFLANVRQTACKNVLVIGGNHDSPTNLNAPKEILKFLNVHVVGKASDNLQDEIVSIKHQNHTELVICAVPFLRDSDIRKAISTENITETERRIKEGIIQHYHQVASLVADYKKEGIPILATGHLYAAKSQTSDSEKEIHIGNQGQIEVERLPSIFDYIALGHIHRPQKVGGHQHIRYSGSPIPLSFSEYNDRKQVIILEIDTLGLTSLQEIEVPLSRPLLSFKGSFAEVEKKILSYEQKNPLNAWAEVKLVLQEYANGLGEKVHALGKEKGIDILKVNIEYDRTHLPSSEPSIQQSLSELTPLEVFKQKCEQKNINLENEDNKGVLEAFQMLLEEVEGQGG
ncbi:MAG: exonuclease SbcCD subunit D C-terminal domain-containing protein [Thermoflexibacter sp.]